MDTEWALSKLREYRSLLVNYDGARSSPVHGDEQLEEIAERLDRRLGTVQAIAREVRPSAATTVAAVPGGHYRRTKGALFSVNLLIGDITDAAEVAEKMKPTAPQLSADELHPMVWHAAATLWQTEHYRQAVQTAAETINSRVQQLVDRRDRSDSGLMNEVFGNDAAVPGKPRLRWPGEANDQSVISMNTGLRGYASGVFSTIRNLSTHSTEEMPKHLALEQLAALSLLARWVEQCEVVRAETA